VTDSNSGGGLFYWHPQIFGSSITGGSAVMYAPGKVLKSGGPNLADSGPHDAAEIIDFSGITGTEGEDYAAVGAFTLVTPMNQHRHFHNLVVLPDGHVVAIGGNSSDNGARGEHWDNPCDDPATGQPINEISCGGMGDVCPSVCSPTGECSIISGLQCSDASDCPGTNPTCESDSRCRLLCTDHADCPPMSGNDGICTADNDPATATLVCDPANVACFATKTAEVFDPSCGTWTDKGEQVRERMYHSTALLRPDGTVLSAGSGGRQGMDDVTNGEIFRPHEELPPGQIDDYAPVDDDDLDPNDEIVVPYGSEVPITADSPELVSEIVLVRLGSTTHGFDTDQRRVQLYDWQEEDYGILLSIPSQWQETGTASWPMRNVAPSGYYMVFMLDASGRVLADAPYIRLCQPPDPALTANPAFIDSCVAASYVCQAGSGLQAEETSCTAEPTSGMCPLGQEITTSEPIPLVKGPSGTVSGWHISVAPGMVADPSVGPTAEEFVRLEQRCAQACADEWRGDAAISATCNSAGAFFPPIAYDKNVAGALDVVVSERQKGEGLFGASTLSCDLGTTCCEAFDEDVCAATPLRTTPADAALGRAPEYHVALGPTSAVKIITATSTVSSALTGSVSYSFCADGNTSEACPFYLGSLNAVATSKLTVNLTCDDNTTMLLTAKNLTFSLAQPAIGMHEKATTTIGFPAGGMMLDTAFDVDTEHFVAHRPLGSDTYVSAQLEDFTADNLDIAMTVPCPSGGRASFTTRLSLYDPNDGSALDRPPSVTNDLPSQVPCNGNPTPLAATASDVDNDLAEVRWLVDDVLIASSISTMVFSAGHTVTVRARDARGATSSDTKVVSCAP